jgi:KISS1 receptor
MAFSEDSSSLSLESLNDGNYSGDWDDGEMAGYGTGILTFQIVVYVVLFLMGVPGNILVLILFARRQVESPFNVANCLVLSLATADLGTLLLYVPFYLAYDAMGLVWPFGLAMCKFVFSFTHVCVYASLGSMVAIAVERYRMTFHLHVSKSWVVIGTVIVWITAILLSIPQMMYLQLIEIDGEMEEEGSAPEYACELVWPDHSYEKLLHPIDFALFYLLPLAFISVLYVKIICVLRLAIRRNVPNHRLAEQSRKVAYILALIVSVFAVCVFPVHFMQLCRVFFHQYWLRLYSEWPWLFSLFAGLYLFTHVINPIIYALLHRKFRVQAIELLRMTQVFGCRHSEIDS